MPISTRYPNAYRRPFGHRQQSRSASLARGGMVATSHPLAAQIALECLQRGGNAVDAALAANAVLTVVEPLSNGIGGDLFALCWDQATRRVHGLNASGRAPQLATREEYSRRGLSSVPETGPLSWTVPGCVSGWEALHGRFGTRPWSEILEPAIQLAEKGFPVPEVIAGYWKAEAQALAAWPDSSRTWLTHGQAPREGDLFRNPALGQTYRILASQGPAAFYSGCLAERLAAASQQLGGLLRLEDLQAHRCEWVEPLQSSFLGKQIWQLPPNGQGVTALQLLNMFQQLPFTPQQPDDVHYLHYLVEMKKLAFEDRARWLSDPDFKPIPVQQLISASYAADCVSRINPERAMPNAASVVPSLEFNDTVYISVVDSQRNACSLIQSIFHHFGSKVTAGDTGIIMHNRGCSFALDPEHRNCLAPGKRPFHTIIPALVTDPNGLFFCFGVMGGDMQAQGQLQVLVNLLHFGCNVQLAGDLARIRHIGSSTPSGQSGGLGTVLCESGFDPKVLSGLRARGHHVLTAKDGFGGYQGILWDAERDVLWGGTECRKDGLAIGF